MWDIVPGSREDDYLHKMFFDVFGARFHYWLTLPFWELHESAALLLGLDPDEIDSTYEFDPDELSLHSLSVTEEVFKQEFNWLHNYHRRLVEDKHRLLERAAKAGQLGKKQKSDDVFTVTPAQLIEWAERNNITFASKLKKTCVTESAMDSNVGQELSPRREKSLLRLVGALLSELKSATGESQAKIIERIVDMHGHKDGISDSSLQNVFGAANRQLDDW